MPQKTNLNVAPYYDDFDPSKNFYKVLFRSGYSIQTRELTSLQSILQNQLESYGKHQFKQGDLVVPGEVGLNNRLDYVKLSSVSEVPVNVSGQIVYQKYDIKQLVGQQLQGVTSGVVGNVLAAEYATATDADTVFVNYVSSGDSSDEETFRQGETLEVINGVNTPLLVVGTDGSVLPTTISVTNSNTGEVSSLESPAMGYASAVKVEEGVYFVNGYFVRCDEELLVIEKYYNRPSAKIGFNIVEKVISPEEDPSLFDNARGFSNSSAPGAHRLQIQLELKKYSYNATTDNNFIQLITILDGQIQRQIRQADYTLIENTLARRTFDESGDYVVNNFPLEVREYYQKEGNLGIHALDTEGTVNGLTPEEATQKLIASVGPGKAYVRGFEIVNTETKYLEVNKARDLLTRDNVTLRTRPVSEFKLTNVFGTVPLNSEGADLTAYPTVYLNSVFNDGSIGLNDTEEDLDHKQTINRRGEVFATDDGIKTIYVKVTSTTNPLATVTDTTIETTYSQLWFIKTRDGSTPSTWDSVDSISFSKVRRAEVDDSELYLELTVKGKKNLLDTFLKEYDEAGPSYLRELFLTAADAQNNANKFGHIVDYNEIINPVVGLAKPKNVYFVERGAGFNQNTDKVISRGRSSTGQEVYNATLGFNYFNPVFFTRLLLDSTLPENNFSASVFSPGQYIVGSRSNAYGVIEGTSTTFFSAGNTLLVRTLSGTFLPGETISDESGNTLRIANENTISHFIVTKRGTGYTNPRISIDGLEYDNSVVDVSVLAGAVYKVAIRDRNAFQTQYSQPPVINLTSTTTPGVLAQVTPVLFRNPVYTYTPQNVKSLHSVYGSGNAYTFTSDIEFNKTNYSEVSPVTEFTFSGEVGRKYIECNGFDGDATRVLVQGDIVQFNDDSGRTIKAVVQYATAPFGARKSRVYLDSSLPEAASNVSVVRLRPQVSNTDTASLIYPTGSREVQSLIKNETDSRIVTNIRRDFVVSGSSSGGTLSFVAQLSFGTQRFVPFSEQNYIFTVLNRGSSTEVANGDILYIDPAYVNIETSTDSTSGLSAGSVTLNLPSNFFGSITSNFPVLKLTATIEVTKARPRLKTSIRNKRIVVVSGGDRVVPLRGQDYDTEEVEIYSYSDVYRLRYVYEGSLTNPPEVDTNGRLTSGTDVTSKYTFDNGQRDTFYDVSRLVLKPGEVAPTGQLVIAFDYFEHTQGDFCTVDSYLHEAGVSADEIPNFNSAVYGNVSLKDVIDFRPKVDNDVTVAGFQNTTTLSVADYAKFVGAGGVTSSTPSSDTNLSYTFSFSETQYLDRIDGIFLNKKGEFIVREGNSSLNPSKPETVDDAIPLYYLHIPSFTVSNKDVRVIPVDNRRYTMRDIGKLEKRIERLEYYTTLSILEQQALNMQVRDNIGMERFKSGFIVDNFETHRGNVASVDYRCSIDTQQAVLRSQSREDSFKLVELNTREDERVTNHYSKTNDFVTLPYTKTRLLGNDFATRTLNPNPFVVIQYVGDAKITPSVDQWYDTTVVPFVSENNTGLFSIYIAKSSDPKEALSSYYNSFVVNWIGSNRNFFNIASLADTNTSTSSSTVVSASVASSSNISPLNNETAQGTSSETVNGNSRISSVQFLIRSVPIKYNLTRLRPNTRLYVFMEDRNINRWTNPDIRYTGTPGNSLSSFDSQITTDENGNASGIILVPAGLPPLQGTPWTGDTKTVLYDTSAEELRFTSGIKTIRFTSSDVNADRDSVQTYAEVKYYATGSLPENPASIVSTRPAEFKANEGVQEVDSTTANRQRPNPLSQTFRVENFDGGVFVTGVDLYFSSKDSDIPLRAYLTNTEIGKPGKHIIPGSVCVKNPNTYLRVFASSDLSITIGESIQGVNSGASGPLLKVLDKNYIEVTASSTGSVDLAPDQVYTLVLSNHNGISFIQNEPLQIASLTTYNALNGTSLTLTIARNSGKVVDLKISNVGSNYDSAIIQIQSPQLPGSSTATGSVNVSNGKIYNAEITLEGNGYTEPPSIVIRGTGTGAAGAVIESVIEITSYAVRMGISTDTTSVTPTFFEFEHPVYLQNNTDYAMVVETDSTNYQIWASRLTEAEVTSGVAVTTQPLLGSVYKSQNTDSWTEDLFEDLKFNMYRAVFNISRSGNLVLTNETLGYEKLEVDPIETYALANTNATSPLFKNNNSIVKVKHRDHGFEDSGDSYVFFKSLSNVGGFTSSVLNSTLFRVSNAGVDYYNIIGPNRASANAIGGGSSGLVTYNRKYERLFAHVSYLQAPSTRIETSVKTTNIVPVDSGTTNYTSYSQTDYERTFLNEEHYFLNQKVIASRINQSLNGINNSLLYKFNLSSTVDHLSPVIDLRVASVKTATNRIENAEGYEARFGKRYQIIKFLPVYRLTVTGNSVSVDPNQSVEGLTSGTRGKVLAYDAASRIVTVQVTSPGTYISSEILYFGSQSVSGGALDGDTVSITAISARSFNFDSGTTVVAFNPSDATEKYDNKISGKIINWDPISKELTIENDKAPINSNYSAEITLGSSYSRDPDIDLQSPDIFRVGDLLFYNDIPTGEEQFLKIGEMRFATGIDFVPETSANNTSAISKYVTREVTINSPGTSIDVRSTINVADISNIKVLYKIKEASSQVNFSDIEWNYFNGDGSPDNNIIATASNSASGLFERSEDYQEVIYSVSELPDFTSFAIKIVMKTDNPVYVPKIQDIRAVASY
jgi:hypothetical protein